MNFSAIFIVIILMVKFSSTRNTFGHLKWNSQSKNFEPIPVLSAYESMKEQNALKTREQETHDFKGEELMLTYYEEPGFFHFYDNDKKASGICGEAWTILSHFLNFTLVLNKSSESSIGSARKGGTYKGILELARLNQTDIVPNTVVFPTRLGAFEFSPPLWISNQRIFAVGQWKRNRAWMFNLMAINVWACILGFIVILSLASLVIQRISIHRLGRAIESESYFDHVLHTFSSLCSQDSTSATTGSGSRLLKLTIGLFSFLTLVAYNARLINSMAEESFKAPFDDLETLLNDTDFVVAVLNGSNTHLTITSPFVIPIFGRIARAGRYTVTSTLDELYEKVCDLPDRYVIFDRDDALAVRGKRKCQVIPVGIPYYPAQTASGITRRVKYRKTLYIGMMKLRESGIVDLLKKRYMTSPNRELSIREADNMAVDMGRVLIIFGIFSLGVVVSIIVCTAENIIYTLKKRKTIERLTKKVSRIKKPTFVDSTLRHLDRKQNPIMKKPNVVFEN